MPTDEELYTAAVAALLCGDLFVQEDAWGRWLWHKGTHAPSIVRGPGFQCLTDLELWCALQQDWRGYGRVPRLATESCRVLTRFGVDSVATRDARYAAL